MREPRRDEEEVTGLRHVCEATIYHHVFTNADREVGGVLVGQPSPRGETPYVSGAIPALKCEEKRATLTFTQDAWEHIHRVLDHQHVGDQIVGWYHSHPGFGIFLSDHDLFIHHHFFSGPSQIAVVVDPQSRTEGVFWWRGGVVELLYEGPTPSGWYVQAPPTPTPTPGSRSLDPPSPEAPTAAARREPYPLVPLAAALLLSFAFVFAIVYFGLLHKAL
jgi:proteasome lid subunit RPN8/RPN11